MFVPYIYSLEKADYVGKAKLQVADQGAEISLKALSDEVKKIFQQQKLFTLRVQIPKTYTLNPGREKKKVGKQNECS